MDEKEKKYERGEFKPTEEYKTAIKNKEAASEALTALGDAKWTYGTDANGKPILGDDVLNGYLSQYNNRDKFTYDLDSDALYQQYKNQYMTQGKLAMEDAMGQAATLTGGYGNSYAATVGNQAYQSYLGKLNEVIPELYQLAYDKYNQEGQELINKIGLLQGERNNYYTRYNEDYNRTLGMMNYYSTEANNLYNRDYAAYTTDETYKYNTYRDSVQDAKDAQQYEDSNAGGGGYTDTLWYATGTYDSNGNPVFRNSENKTMSFGQGINPYTGTKHPDAKHGTFSNGYQPNNIGGTKLKNSGMSTNVTGKNQTIWEANGKYWLWRGDLNKYIEIDVSDLD